MIKNNFIDGAVGGGIVMGDKSSAQVITVENNRIANIRPQPDNEIVPVVGVRLFDATRGEVVNNTISVSACKRRPIAASACNSPLPARCGSPATKSSISARPKATPRPPLALKASAYSKSWT